MLESGALSPWSWSLAADLLVPPPDDREATLYRQLPAAALLEALASEHQRLQGRRLDRAQLEESSLPGLALALLERPWSQEDRSALRQGADALRRKLAGDTVTYVVNRNLNASNHCVKHCAFCAFRRDPGEPGAYWLRGDELARRAAEARRLGATELCVQGGLNPAARLDGSQLAHAEQLLGQLQQAAPGVHLHAFSPQELLFFAEQDGLPLDTVLQRLKRAGLGSVPGTAAEVLTERVRRVLCPEKLSARQWVAVMLQVHAQGLPATATLMAGHLEAPADLAAHLITLITLQSRARAHGLQGFSEFVLLPFVGAAAPAPLRRRVGRDQPDLEAMLLLTALARLILGPWITNHQPSWVKLTLAGAQRALRWGCNDLGGTLMEEHITTMAGARGGTAQSAADLRRSALQLGRPVQQRTTLYAPVS
ncbi:CofH family radical SAM protein [Cyanobium sp. NIES-981]|uniref:CofH family radical SAM protein n=1 Tax=Cyanobium sp. NIES-981 TaxID=1851505 RepID=UPI001CEDF9B3|nr:CofH family radical SAM protein [Cyanobium sp. NIES-981]